MHWKSKIKIQRETTKLYLTKLKTREDIAYEIRFQLGKKDFVLIDLMDNFPKKVYYQSLKNGGFNYNPEIDDQIIRYGKRKVLEILKNSKSFNSINSDTIDKVIKLIDGIVAFLND